MTQDMNTAMDEPIEAPEDPETSEATKTKRIAWRAFQWHTDDEVKFVEGLGTHRLKGPGPHPPLPAKDRLAALISYRRTMLARTNWGWVNPFAVAGYVDLEIDQLIADLRGGDHLKQAAETN